LIWFIIGAMGSKTRPTQLTRNKNKQQRKSVKGRLHRDEMKTEIMSDTTLITLHSCVLVSLFLSDPLKKQYLPGLNLRGDLRQNGVQSAF